MKCYLLFFLFFSLIRSKNYLLKQKKREPRVRWELASHTARCMRPFSHVWDHPLTNRWAPHSSWEIFSWNGYFRDWCEMVTLGTNSESQWNIRLVSNKHGAHLLVRDNDLIHWCMRGFSVKWLHWANEIFD